MLSSECWNGEDNAKLIVAVEEKKDEGCRSVGWMEKRRASVECVDVGGKGRCKQ